VVGSWEVDENDGLVCEDLVRPEESISGFKENPSMNHSRSKLQGGRRQVASGKELARLRRRQAAFGSRVVESGRW
jgi:hypothetical protein